MELLKSAACTNCGVIFRKDIAQSNSSYDHSRPELCFVCQRPAFFVKQPDEVFNPWDLRVKVKE